MKKKATWTWEVALKCGRRYYIDVPEGGVECAAVLALLFRAFSPAEVVSVRRLAPGEVKDPRGTTLLGVYP